MNICFYCREIWPGREQRLNPGHGKAGFTVGSKQIEPPAQCPGMFQVSRSSFSEKPTCGFYSSLKLNGCVWTRCGRSSASWWSRVINENLNISSAWNIFVSAPQSSSPAEHVFMGSGAQEAMKVRRVMKWGFFSATLAADIHGSYTVNLMTWVDPQTFYSRAAMRFTFVVSREISQQLLNGLPWNLVQTFTSPSGRICTSPFI